MRASLLIALALIAGCSKGKPTGSTVAPPPQAAPQADTGDRERLKGTWRVVAIEAAGQKALDDRVKSTQLSFVFDGSNVTIKRPDRPAETGSYTLDSRTTPRRIIIHKSDVLLSTKGLYAIDGNTLRLCLMVDDNPDAGFPAALQSRPSPKTDLLTLERQ